MGRFICKFQDGDTAYYLEWSTVVDAPATRGMSLDEFTEYHRIEYGSIGLEFQDRMNRVEEKGTSAFDYASVDEVIEGNRAGDDETCLTKEQIIEIYCRRETNGHGEQHEIAS